MATIEDVRKLLQDFIAPDLSTLKEDQLQQPNDLLAKEVRLLKAIESAKTEVLLTVKVNTMSERIAELTRENERLKGERAQ